VTRENINIALKDGKPVTIKGLNAWSAAECALNPC